MLTGEKLKEAVGKLFAEIVLSGSEIDRLLHAAVDPAYWRTLCPEMGLVSHENPDHLERTLIRSDEEKWALRRLDKDGYFQLPAIISPAVIGKMRSAVESVRKANWPVVFSFVYDEFWTVVRTPLVARFLSDHLGPGYRQTAPIWTYRVDPQTRSSGWPPHADGRQNRRLTVWIPLTEATIGNGCMYVIPQSCIPPELPERYMDWTSVSRQDLGILLHHVSPLPAAPGAVLGWNHGVIHWGGQAMDQSAGPRISIAVEFLGEGEKPLASELPVFDSKLPDLPVRLCLIGRAMLDYEKFEPAMRRHRDLAVRLTELGLRV